MKKVIYVVCIGICLVLIGNLPLFADEHSVFRRLTSVWEPFYPSRIFGLLAMVSFLAGAIFQYRKTEMSVYWKVVQDNSVEILITIFVCTALALVFLIRNQSLMQLHTSFIANGAISLSYLFVTSFICVYAGFTINYFVNKNI